MFRILVVFSILIFSGCQAIVYGTATDFSRVSVGMTKAEVVKEIGNPVSIAADVDKGEEYLIYKRMKHAISEWPRTYMVTLRDGKVVKYGEQYQEQNLNTF